MKQRGRPTTSLAQLDDLRPLVGERGPFLSAYLALRPATEDLAEATRIRWEGLREQAEADGAPAAVLGSVDAAIVDAHRRGGGLCVVTSVDGSTHIEHMVDPPPHELAVWRTSPVLAPLIAERQWLQPHIVVLADRLGANISVSASGSLEPASTATVDGDTHPIRKVQPGGWSQRRFQQRAEETWHHNMAAAADELSSLVRKYGTRVVAVGGDERAVGLLRDALPEEVQERIVPIAATRAPDGSSDHLDEEIRAVLQDWATAQLEQTLAAFREELGQHDRATSGPPATLAALRSSQVAHLLVQTDPEDPRQAWIGPSADQVATGAEDLPEEPQARPAPLLDAAVAAALATGADVQVFSGDQGPPEGIAALLRW